VVAADAAAAREDEVRDNAEDEKADANVDDPLLLVVLLLESRNSVKYCKSDEFIRFNNSIASFSHPSSDITAVDNVDFIGSLLADIGCGGVIVVVVIVVVVVVVVVVVARGRGRSNAH